MSREKRSISLHGHRTSVALDTEYWDIIDQVVAQRGVSLAAFIAEMDDARVLSKSEAGLAGYLRVWVVRHLRDRLNNS